VTQPPPRAVGGGAFDVDITQAPQAIRQLEQAREELESIKRDAVYLGQIRPPSNDQVSLDAARALGETATTGPGSFIASLTLGIEELTRMIDSLRSGFADYQRTDDDAGARLSSLS
jgi:hypothetical protein